MGTINSETSSKILLGRAQKIYPARSVATKSSPNCAVHFNKVVWRDYKIHPEN